MILSGPFQSLPFCDYVILSAKRILDSEDQKAKKQNPTFTNDTSYHF